MVDLSSFDFIWYYVLADGYFQVAVQEIQELCNHLQVEDRVGFSVQPNLTVKQHRFQVQTQGNAVEIITVHVSEKNISHQGLVALLD